MAVDWKERLMRHAEDERLLEAIKTGDYRAALMALFVEVRRVEICKHGNITNYRLCPQCVDELDRLGLDDEDDSARR